MESEIESTHLSSIGIENRSNFFSILKITQKALGNDFCYFYATYMWLTYRTPILHKTVVKPTVMWFFAQNCFKSSVWEIKIVTTFLTCLSDCLHEILFDDEVSVGPNGEHTSFGANVTQIGAVKIIGKLYHCSRSNKRKIVRNGRRSKIMEFHKQWPMQQQTPNTRNIIARTIKKHACTHITMHAHRTVTHVR